MSKKHYIAMARRFAALRKEAEEIKSGEFASGFLTGLNQAVLALTEQLQIDRPEFNRTKFLEACGVSV